MSNTCSYYGKGSNTSAGYCQNDPTWDLGRYMNVVGLPYQVRFACDEHASRIVPFRWRKSGRGQIGATR